MSSQSEIKEDTPIFRPMTKDEFGGQPYNGINIVEDGNADYLFSHGHINAHDYAKAVNDFDKDERGDVLYGENNVSHVWAVATDWDRGEWHMSWKGTPYEDAVNRFPVTIVDR